MGPLNTIDDESNPSGEPGGALVRQAGGSFNILYLLKFVPKNVVSHLTGLLVRIKLPKILQGYVNLGFVRLFGIDMTEAGRPLADYRCLEDLFVRELRPNSRKVSGVYVSSADGRVEMSRPLSGGQAIQAKGLSYSVQELIYGSSSGNSTKNSALSPAWYTTVYLAPHNYHRVHAPVAGKVLGIRYIPGELWPVNRSAVSLVPRLFVRNERLVFEFALDQGAKAWLVMVGALNVGRMSTNLYPGFVTNSFHRLLSSSTSVRELVPAGDSAILAAGDELGVFMLGSTTVTLLDAKAVSLLKPREISSPAPVRMGESLSVQ